MFGFVFVAGTLATLAAMVLLVPLVRRRADGKPVAMIAAMGALVAVLLGGAGLYAAFSNYSWTEATPVADTPAAMTAKLAQRLAREPNDLAGWLLLGRSYTELGQFPLAVRAYQRADRLANGKNVEAVLGVGETLLAQDAESIRGPAGRLFEQALELDPNSAKALFYSAFAALTRGDRPLARERFQRMLELDPPEAVRTILQQQIAALDAAGAAGAEPIANDGARISVRVTLAPALASKVPAGATLFVAARDPRQPGPPFAVKRLPATFPVDVELSAGDAMLESRRIAAGQQLEVVARVALGGTPTASRGDPFGQVGYHVGKDGRLSIVIDKLAP
jgi:cytochrome c-type biogenesis protein CcmH